MEPSERDKLGITFSADIAFMGSEEAGEDMQSSFVMYDDDEKAFCVASMQSKAVTETIFDQSGYKCEKLCFKSDQAMIIVALKRAVAAARTEETVPIESPVRASKSNGMMESAIGIWQSEPTQEHQAIYRGDNGKKN